MNRTRNPAKEAIPSNTLHAASTHRRHFWRASVLSPPRARPEAHGPVSCIRHAARTHACARRAAFPIQYSSRPPLSMLIHHLNRKPADGRPAYSYCAARNDFVAPDPSWTVPAAYHVVHPADASASGLGGSSGLDQGVAITMSSVLLGQGWIHS